MHDRRARDYPGMSELTDHISPEKRESRQK